MQASRALRKAHVKILRKTSIKNFMQKVARAHVRRRKLLKKGEAEGGEATPLGAEGGEATPGAEGGEATPLGAEGGEATPLGEAAPGSPEPVPEVPLRPSANRSLR